METLFSSRLKQCRKDRGLSQEDLASLCEIPYSSYCRYERGVGEPPLSVAMTLAKTLHVSLDHLCGLSDLPPQPAEGLKERMLLQKIRKLLEEADDLDG